MDIINNFYKAFGIYKKDVGGIEDQPYSSIPESQGYFSAYDEPYNLVDNITPHDAVDLAIQRGSGVYTGDDGHQIGLRPRDDGKPGLFINHRVHGGRANRALYSSDGTIRDRESKANEWIQHFAEHPGVTQIDPIWQERMDMYGL